ncbi:FAD-binding oxidoreductase [soil metagenome]
MTDFTSLRPLVSGPVFLPTDDGFAEEAAGFNLAIVHHPDAVVGAASAEDIAAVVRFAREHGLRVRVQATGHGAEAPITGGILVTTKRLDTLSIDAGPRLATVGAGVRWGDVVAAAADLGLAPVTGSSPTVGAVGLITGGGLGPLARSHGFASDYVRGFTVVTGAGEVVEANPDEHADLFWALRGGKWGLGIVTGMRLQLVELEMLYAGDLMFAEEHIETVARAWSEWTKSAPGDVTTSVAIFRFPDLDFMPPPLRGRTLLDLRFAMPGDAEAGERAAAPLRAAAPVYLDNLGPLAARDIARVHNDPLDAGPGWATGALLSDVDSNFITAWLDIFGSGQHVPAMLSELRHLGSAAGTDVADGSAAGGRAAAYTLTVVGAPDPALFVSVVPALADRVFDALGPWLADETNVNFIGVPRPGQTGRPWTGERLTRLEAVRASYDPAGVFA